jgi:3-hydroxybutyryl-CoA dehydrogenase
LSIERVGVVGAGTMGAGIAQLACLGGLETWLHDPVPEALASGRARVVDGLAKGAGRGMWSEAEAAAAEERLHLADGVDELAGCQLAIEAAPEDLSLKRALFTELAEHCGPDAILATNTSSLSVTAIAAGVERPERVCGMHFFNPPPLMRLVEIVAGDDTSSEALDAATEVALTMRREPIRAADAIGFVANRCARPFTLEALRLLGDRVAPIDQIDRIVRIGGGFRMGPFELMDLVGVDVNFEVAKSFWEQSFHEPRWQPSPIQARTVAAGRCGRKAGRGYYDYGDGPHRPDDPVPPEATEPSVYADPVRFDGEGFAAVNIADAAELAAPGPLNTLQFTEERRPIAPDQLVYFLALPTLSQATVVELARGPETADTALSAAGAGFAAMGKHVECVADYAPGLVLGRILAQIVNEAHFALAQGVATPEDCDTAMRLGFNWPRGPFEWGGAIGLGRCVAILDALHRSLGEDRYRVSPLLRSRGGSEPPPEWS